MYVYEVGRGEKRTTPTQDHTEDHILLTPPFQLKLLDLNLSLCHLPWETKTCLFYLWLCSKQGDTAGQPSVLGLLHPTCTDSFMHHQLCSLDPCIPALHSQTMLSPRHPVTVWPSRGRYRITHELQELMAEL